MVVIADHWIFGSAAVGSVKLDIQWSGWEGLRGAVSTPSAIGPVIVEGVAAMAGAGEMDRDLATGSAETIPHLVSHSGA